MKGRFLIVAAALAFSACGRSAPQQHSDLAERRAAPQAPPANATAPLPADGRTTAETLADRLDAIDNAVRGWKEASDLATAHRFAEQARNLVVGPAGPFYGDADGDGAITGATGSGLLPGLKGEPGLASAAPNACVTRDVLGGDWSDPTRRWQILRTAIANWRSSNNTFPKLPSHPQRIVGWATLAIGTSDLPTAREYASHAKLHVDVSKRAMKGCAG